MNQLEQLVAEWLQYNRYIVFTNVKVGRLPRGGYSGELDVVAFHPKVKRLLHIECSTDADSHAQRDAKFSRKFEKGRLHAAGVFDGLDVPSSPEQFCVMVMPAAKSYGNGCVIPLANLMSEIHATLSMTSPLNSAVPENLPLLRTLQQAWYFRDRTASEVGLLCPLE